MNVTCENCGIQYFAGYSDALCPEGCDDRCPSCEGWLNFGKCHDPKCEEYVRSPLFGSSKSRGETP